jgi:hypothetical protein
MNEWMNEVQNETDRIWLWIRQSWRTDLEPRRLPDNPTFVLFQTERNSCVNTPCDAHFVPSYWTYLVQTSVEVKTKLQISFNNSKLSEVLPSLQLQTLAKWNKTIIANRFNAKIFLTNAFSLVHTGTHSSHDTLGENLSENSEIRYCRMTNSLPCR